MASQVWQCRFCQAILMQLRELTLGETLLISTSTSGANSTSAHRMESLSLQPLPEWGAWGYQLLAPQIQVRGHMALFVLIAVLLAFGWLLLRAYTVINTPNDILVDKLGLDIPPEPLLTLEGIEARQVQISWKPLETTSSIQEYHIELNGKPVGVTKKHETAAVISSLNSSTFYAIRVFSVSPGRFQTPSSILHLRTTKTSSTSSQDSNNDGCPQVNPLVPRVASVPTITPPPVSAREQNSTQVIGRRGTGVRKASPVGLVEPVQDLRDVYDEPVEDLAELSQQFSEINAEIDAINAQILEEEREFEIARQQKEAQRTAYQAELKERDEVTNDLRKQVNRAETACRALANERQKKEKALKDKENARQKRISDMAKWEEGVKTIEQEMEGINKQKEALRRRKEYEIREVKEKTAEEQREITQLEEEIEERRANIKELQEERRRNAVDEETDESREADRLDQERDARFHDTIAALSQQYNSTWQELQKWQQEHVLARQRLAMLDTARRSTAVSFAPMAPMDMDMMRRGDRTIRRPRHASSHGSNVSSPRVAYAPEPLASIHQTVTTTTTTSSPLTNRNSLFNTVNGMTTTIGVHHNDDDDDDESMLAAPMSPRADALLPTDLLGDDSADEMAPDEEDMPTKPTQAGSGLSPFPAFKPTSLHGVERTSDDSPSPPRSASSPRSFTSPREEFFPDNDQDGRSIRSSHPPIPEDAPVEAPTHKRLTSMSNLFSFNRQRGKTSSDQLPALGSLKQESHSFPRKIEDFDSAMQPRRRLSYGGNWAFPGGNFLGKQSEDEEGQPPKPSITRRAFPNILPGIGKGSASRNYDPFAPRTHSMDPGGRGGSSSPRPGSTYSFDVGMPRSSMDDPFRVWRTGGARNSPLVPDWGSGISRSHSRRPSVGYNSTTNLSLHLPDEEIEFIEPPNRDSRPLQAPIGTRPTSSSQNQNRPSTPKLNPNAPAFNMFGFGKNKDKTKEKDKDKEKLKMKDESTISGSPPESRKSKDTHSIAPTTSTLESRESLERIQSGLSSAPGTAGSLESTPATASKPTFISKITRKASSNKFDSWKSKALFTSSRKTGESTTPTGDITEDENHSGSTEHLGRSVESNGSTPAATPTGEDLKKGSRSSLGSWNFMRKKPKVTTPGREDLTASEISEDRRWEGASESGHTTDADVDRFSHIDENEARPTTT